MNLDSPEPENPDTAEHEYRLDPNEPYPVVISPFHFILLSTATMGAYCIWWQYKCWVYFKEKEKSSILPALWALTFVILALPVIPLSLKIASYCKQDNSRAMRKAILIWLACMAINFSGYALKTRFPALGPLLGAFIFVPLLLPVMEFNAYFTGNPNGFKDDKLNTRQIALLVIGAILWASVIQAILTGNFPPPDPFK